MNLLCPNCQVMLAVAEQNAGQLMKCHFCSKYFSVPALPQTLAVPSGTTIPPNVSFQAAPVPPASAFPPPRPPPESDVFVLPPEPAPPQTSPPLPEERIAVRSAPPPQQQPRDKAPPPPPPTGYQHTFTIWISPRVIPWIAPVALFLALVLVFFPWTGVCPGGYAVYTQSAFQMIWGVYSVDADGEAVLRMKKDIDAAIRANWLMIFYLLLVLVGLVLAVAPIVLAHTSFRLPPAVERIWPWRTALVLATTGLAFLILLAFLARGSGLESAVATLTEKEPAPATRQEEIERGLKISSRTPCPYWSAFFQVIALAGAGLELWLEKRGPRPLPRIEAHW